MPAPNLTGVVSRINDLMLDDDGAPVVAVRISRDPQVEGDDEFDVEDGTWARPGDDSTVTYEGPCLLRVQPRSGLDAASEIGYQEQAVTLWAVTLPLGSDVLPGDIVTITTSQRDAMMLGRTAVVATVLGGAFAVGKRFTAVERTPTPFGRGDQP